ncbi:MAG: hypothetical protein CXZ00_08690 [Acidobacteria bacterium]|nr:MAG: hypothetical protein CXZ00_08690 [Acidobacteriota bacterium]
MTESHARKDENVEQKPAAASEKESRFHRHVKVIIARVLAKQRADTKKRPIQYLDIENEGTEPWH